MRKAALMAGALVLPLVLSLPAMGKGLMEQAQDEGMRQAQAAGHKHGQAKRLGSTNGAATTTGAAPSDRSHSRGQPFGMDSGSAKGGK